MISPMVSSAAPLRRAGCIAVAAGTNTPVPSVSSWMAFWMAVALYVHVASAARHSVDADSIGHGQHASV